MRKPGTRSNASLLTTAAWTLISLTVLIGGHVLLLLLLWDSFETHSGIMGLADYTGLHKGIIWLWIIAALGMDIWVSVNARKQSKKAMQR